MTTVFGNASVENTTRNALAILELAGIDAPVALGCSEPLIAPAAHTRAMHGKTGLDGADIPAPTRSAIETHAVDLIIALAEQHRGELVVAAIGPNTNLALALKREPRLRLWLREVTIMGGSATLGTVTPVAEFNIHADPEAAAVLEDDAGEDDLVNVRLERDADGLVAGHQVLDQFARSVQL